MSADSGATESGSSSSSNRSGLGAGAIAGIAIACVAVVIAIIFVILRKRRKWLRAGFAAAAPKTEPDESFFNGPVFNSATRSAADGSTAYSAADISAARSTAEHSRSAADSPAKPPTVGEGVAVAGGSTVELDARDTQVRPHTELDSRERETLTTGSTLPIARNPGVYELLGREVTDEKRREVNRSNESLAADDASSEDGDEDQGHSPPSPLTSTVDDDGRLQPRFISPTTPTGQAPRAM